MLMSAEHACLLVVDIQDRLAPAIDGGEAAQANAIRLIKGASVLDLPVLASEQYPKGLGHTVAAVAEQLPQGAVIEKMHFSCAAEPELVARLAQLAVRQVVVCGMEAHVCVLQTAIGLVGLGYEVFVVADAVGSRTARNRDLAVERMRSAGVGVVSTEMVLFEWMGKAGTPEFKTISGLIK